MSAPPYRQPSPLYSLKRTSQNAAPSPFKEGELVSWHGYLRRHLMRSVPTLRRPPAPGVIDHRRRQRALQEPTLSIGISSLEAQNKVARMRRRHVLRQEQPLLVREAVKVAYVMAGLFIGGVLSWLLGNALLTVLGATRVSWLAGALIMAVLVSAVLGFRPARKLS